jgi:hypothetical protein
MENLLVVKQIGAIATIASIAELDDMIVGDLIAVGDGREIIGVGSAAADLTSLKEIKFITKLADGKFRVSAPINRFNITSYSEQLYSAPQNKVVRIGGITALLTLNIPSTGEGNITVRNLSYDHTIATQRINASVTKNANETPEAYVDRVIAQLNTAMTNTGNVFATAAKVIDGTNTFLGITFTCANEHVDLALSLDGIFAGVVPVTTTEAKCGLGKGTDILAMEKDYTKNLGNSGYVELPDLWYSAPNQVDSALNFNVITLGWDGIASTATTNRQVARNTMTFAAPTASTFATITAFFQLILGNTYAMVGGAEPGDEPDTNAIDNAVS